MVIGDNSTRFRRTNGEHGQQGGITQAVDAAGAACAGDGKLAGGNGVGEVDVADGQGAASAQRCIGFDEARCCS